MKPAEVDALAGRKLDIAVARELGILAPGNHYQIMRRTVLPDGSWQSTEWRDLPHYSTEIAAAWELNGDGWEWSFEEKNGLVFVTVFVDGRAIPDSFDETFTNCEVGEDKSKATTYATARCRAWLKARMAEITQ
jgi:hypothetical protein